MRLYWRNVVKRTRMHRRRHHHRLVHILPVCGRISWAAAAAAAMRTQQMAAPTQWATVMAPQIIMANRRSPPGSMKYSKAFWPAKHAAWTAKQWAAKMSISSIYKWMSIKIPASHIVCDALAIRKRFAVITNSNVTIVVTIKRLRSECGLKNYQWYYHCIWSVSNTWSNTIGILKYHIGWFFHSNCDYSIRYVCRWHLTCRWKSKKSLQSELWKYFSVFLILFWHVPSKQSDDAVNPGKHRPLSMAFFVIRFRV